jgi:16S rRNA (uracil1498-N3)-methyltransferase
VGLLQVNEKLSPGKIVLLEGEALKLLKEQAGRVGGLITIRDKRERDFRGRVVRLTCQLGEALVFESFGAPVEPPIEIHLIQALPKKEKFEWIIQKATELGVSSVLPCESDHSITLEERNSRQEKSHRWQAVATKAAQQSRRARIPALYPVLSFRDAVEIGQENDLNLLLWEKESSKGIRRALTKLRDTVSTVTLVAGPDGGFSPREVGLAQQKGFTSVGLGERILRAETAAIVAITILQYELGDLGGRRDQENGKRLNAQGERLQAKEP